MTEEVEPVFGFRPNQPVQWFARALRRSNQHCLYCGALVGIGSRVKSDKEHLIGRRFVPRKSLGSTDFNFIFRACVDCNQLKANAERHVSTITLLTSPARDQDVTIDQAAVRKANRDYHPHFRGTLVSDAGLRWNLRSQLGDAELTFGLDGPPQLDSTHVRVLACNQIQALFALITSRDPRDAEQTRLLPAAQWHLLGYFPFRDWGNRQLVAVAERVKGWPLLAGIVSAGGHFKAVLRRREEQSTEWFWALEWNKSVRVAGAIFAQDRTPPVFEELPEHPWIQLSDTVRMREEFVVTPEADSLFSW